MIRIRPFEEGDLAALYDISLATGDRGRDAAHLYEDRQLIGHIYAAPYAKLQPELVLVVEDEHGVGGFVLGTPDTATWVRRLEEEWWPSLRLVYDDPGLAPAPSWSADQKRASMIHRPNQPIVAIIERYLAHVHLNLAPRLQGQGLAHQLFAEWIKTASGRGVAAIHLGANPDNHRAISFWLRQGFRALNPDEPSPRVVWMGRL